MMVFLSVCERLSETYYLMKYKDTELPQPALNLSLSSEQYSSNIHTNKIYMLCINSLSCIQLQWLIS